MSITFTVTFQGLEQVIGRLNDIGEKAPISLEKQLATLAQDTEDAWQGATPKRSGKLQEGDKVVVEGLSFTGQNGVYYYPFVDKGHETPAGWRTRHGYRPAKRRSHVAARNITAAAVEFIEENIEDYLSKFLDDV